jgi:hypothetical protein
MREIWSESWKDIGRAVEDQAVRTEICLTVDTEFSIAGAFGAPGRYAPLAEPAVRCEVDGKEQGLGFILDMLAAHDASATFFVEALNPAYFGDAPMKGVAERILAAGHDVQLHLHPCWLHFRNAAWQSDLVADPNDSCAGRTPEELNAIIGGGLAAFERWGVPAPVAVRSGNLQADLGFYRALEGFGVRLASNIGVGVFRPREKALQLAGGRHWVDRILEVPVLSYYAPRLGGAAPMRALTITGSSWAETKSLLLQARGAGISPVVILTHPSEFVKQRGFRFENLRRNRVNQTRLLQLLRFVKERDQDFASVTFRDRARDWLAGASTDDPVLRVPAGLTLARMVQNGVNDWIPAY